ncbi:hypothetical protein E8E13_002097 [Curvularia kusanoi]|uniref:FAD/NAD(P)-binding domain-containing protein n=1 Tax=Curvularia kusanoi TaxID=90978 RepID=A0A9P4T759_CURKU|nr:hypothetical protein E8E13_002097 [Curvularia kusanoi]
MTEQRNIVVLGASVAGLQSTHYIMKHILPALKQHKKEAKYHVYLINPSPNWWFRPASPRVAASTTRMASEKILFDVRPGLAQYSKDDITFLEATATAVDDAARSVTYRLAGPSHSEETLPYHALIVATGSSTHHPAFSMSGSTETTLSSISLTNSQALTAKSIVIVGGGPTAVEFAGEVAEHLNGKPGWFSTKTTKRKTNITLITSSSSLLPALRPALANTAASKLSSLGVDIIYNNRVVSTSRVPGTERTQIQLAKGDRLEADLYVPASGVSPNTSFLPPHLLDERKYLLTNPKTLRVDAANSPRVYAFGDVASYSRNCIPDIMFALPALAVNLKRDLLAYDAKRPGEKPKGRDREYVRDERATQLVPLGTMGGVGEAMGWKLPSWVVWVLKGRDYMLGMSGAATASGDVVKKEIKWSREEAVV